VVLLLGATACSGSVGRGQIRSAEGSITGLTVSGPVGSAPSVRMAAPLTVERTQHEVVDTGTGAPVQIDQLFVLELTLYDARTGAEALSTYDPGGVPLVAKSTDDTLFPALARAIVGQRQGSRLVLALTSADAYGSGGSPPVGVRTDDPVVAVADVVAVPPTEVLPAATGGAKALPAGAPAVRYAGRQPVSLDLAGSPAPAPGVRVLTLIEGTGPAVREHSLVAVDYLGQVWGRTVPFADTYFKEPQVVPVGAEGTSATWDAALGGARRGSRLLVIGPAGAYGVAATAGIGKDVTTAWVIDVLGVS